MDDRNGRRRRRDGHGDGVASLVLGVLVAGVVLGCAPDHRISLAEFVEMQEEMRQPPTTQPALTAEDRKEIVATLDRQLGPYRLGAGDVVLVTLTGLGQQALLNPVQVRVDHEGKIRLPTVGSLQVGGMELEDAEDAIRAAYVPKVFRDVAVHVGLMESDSTNVLVTGAVTAPGLVPLRRTERNLLFAIVGAGGVSEVASGEVTLRRLRPPGEVTTLPLTEPEGLKAALALDALEDGDIVTVHAATPNTIIVGGLVNAPRPQPYPPGVQMTVLQALAAAGGLRTDVTPREASLIRRMPDGQDVHVKLDLDRVTSGRDPNITLAGGDILWVPHTVETRVQDWINKNIFFRAGISTTATINYNAQAFEYLNTNAERRTGTGLGDGGTLQDAFDPYGFLLQNQALQQIPTTPSGP